ncbi:MAG: twin-arginine translocase subunit TatC [Chloroflexi bacterium]|nr:twin-arginine translocase subunit TatC [Chloroflexota bacterium]
MADTEAVAGTATVLADRMPADSPQNPGAPAAKPDEVMSLVDHLTELRNRIVRSILAVVIGSTVGFAFARQIRELLVSPLPVDSRDLQVFGPGDAFGITLRIALMVGIILAMPVLLYQLWAFVSPGLTPIERKALRPWIPLALFFFALGVTIAWIVLPFAIGFLLAFTDATLVANLAAPPYFDFVTTMFLAFGLLMEFPIVLYALARVGILSSSRLTTSRRMVILGIAIFAAVATPGGDLISPLVLGGTMYILFELTVVAIRRSGR